jgi:hypothetical protein
MNTFKSFPLPLAPSVEPKPLVLWFGPIHEPLCAQINFLKFLMYLNLSFNRRYSSNLKMGHLLSVAREETCKISFNSFSVLRFGALLSFQSPTGWIELGHSAFG